MTITQTQMAIQMVKRELKIQFKSLKILDFIHSLDIKKEIEVTLSLSQRWISIYRY